MSILTPTLLPTVTPTPTTRPTLIPPGWVTDFAEPILAAIAGREPDFQDDFSTTAGGWKLEEWCAAWRAKIADGRLLLTSCTLGQMNDVYTDFVAEVEGRFVSVGSEDTSWSIHFRWSDIGGDNVGITYHGGMFDCPATGRVAHSVTQSNRLVWIAKGSQIAVYVNGIPVCFKERELRQGYLALESLITGYGEDNVVSFDNFKVWDITDVSLPSTP
jgi:hypothetical protein